MVTSKDFELVDLSAACRFKVCSGQDKCSFIRIHYSGPREGAVVVASASGLAFHHFTQSTRFTFDTAVGSAGQINFEDGAVIGTNSKAGEVVSLINAATFWQAWLDGAVYDTSLTKAAGALVAGTYGTAEVSSSDRGAAILTDSEHTKYHQIGIGYMDKFTDLKRNQTDDDVRGPNLKDAGDPDNQKQGHAEVDAIVVNGSIVTGSTVQATLSVVGVKVAATGVEVSRVIQAFNIASLNNAAILGLGKDYLKGELAICSDPGERLIVRLETADSLDTATINVGGRWVANPGLGA